MKEPIKPAIWIATTAVGALFGGIAALLVAGEWKPVGFVGGGIVGLLCVAMGALLRKI
jgi:hypothetical protein